MTSSVNPDAELVGLPDVWEGITRPEPSRRPRIVAGFVGDPPAEIDERPLRGKRSYREFRHPGAERADKAAVGQHLVVSIDEAWDLLALVFRAPDVRLTRRGALVSDASATRFHAGAVVALLALASLTERDRRWSFRVPTGAEVSQGALVQWFDDYGDERISLASQVPFTVAEAARSPLDPVEGWNALVDGRAGLSLEFDGTVCARFPGAQPGRTTSVRMTPAAVAAVLALCARNAALESALMATRTPAEPSA